MKIVLTDIDIAIIIMCNITKATGTGTLNISLPNDIVLTIDYQENTLDSRQISVFSKGICVKKWKGGEIVVKEIEDCIKNLNN